MLLTRDEILSAAEDTCSNEEQRDYILQLLLGMQQQIEIEEKAPANRSLYAEAASSFSTEI